MKGILEVSFIKIRFADKWHRNEIQCAMAAEAEASREARAKVIAAEGEQRAARLLIDYWIRTWGWNKRVVLIISELWKKLKMLFPNRRLLFNFVTYKSWSTFQHRKIHQLSFHWRLSFSHNLGHQMAGLFKLKEEFHFHSEKSNK